MAEALALQARGLRKAYRQVVAVESLNLEVEAGTVLGFLGPNGAGKTTVIRLLSTILRPDAGWFTVAGVPHAQPALIRRRIGVLPESAGYPPGQTGEEWLTFHAELCGRARGDARATARRLLAEAGLAERGGSLISGYSRGMRQRLGIARALVNDPDVVLLDEPTTGLDPQARHLVWERLFRLKQQGVTQVLTTHYMDEAEQLCDRLVVMDGGRIVAEGSPRALIERYSTREVVELRFAADSQEAFADKLTGLGERIEVLPDRILLYVTNGDDAVDELQGRALRPASVLVRRSTLEDVFLRLTGRTLVD